MTTHRRLARAVPEVYEHGLAGRRPTSTPLEVLHLWRMQAREVLDARCLPLYPFVPLMRDPRPARVLLSELRGRIMQDAPSEKDAEDLAAAACYIALRSFDKDLVESVFGGAALMAKTDLGQMLIRQGEEKGREKGRKEGRQEGHIEARREALLTVLEARFGAVEVGVRRQIEGMADIPRLDALVKHASKAPTFEAFKAGLRSRR